VLPGNWPVRALLLALTFWFGLTLADQLLEMLAGPRPVLAPFATAADLVRAGAWLASFPLLAHTLVDALARVDEGARRGAFRLLPA
jgi:hypothetical protein